MAVNDFIEERMLLGAHRYTFSLWPQQWVAYNLPDLFRWEIHPFQRDQTENIPSKPGIYSFVIQPGIAAHPSCSYLMYIGKTARTLQQRFREYFREQQNVAEGRPKILALLNQYQNYLYFCCSVIADTERIGEIEDALISAFIPPCNDQLPAAINRIAKGFQ